METTNSIDEHLINYGIAIIGMAGRFPGANTVNAFWQNLCLGKESITFFTDEELAKAGVIEKIRRDKNYVPAKGILDNIAGFDAAFFNINPREAELMDPQQRIFLECAWEVFENAGIDPDKFTGKIGTFASASKNTYLLFNILSHPEIIDPATAVQILIANEKDYISSRTAYKLNLRGPAVTIQTACSSSLVAVHLACQSLLSGECEMALAGGVSIDVPHHAGYLYQTGGIFSPDGHCRVFDANAKGTVFGQGVGIVLLKPLAAALNDHDTIHAVIRSSAMNNDGSNKTGFTAPSVAGQAAVIEEAIKLAAIDANTISAVEAHGTGTQLGDPIEVEALKMAFELFTQRKNYCAIGSVKSNIGHLNAAAGIVGMIKTSMSLQDNLIPASLHYEKNNPLIDFKQSPFFVSVGHQYPNDTPRRASVSSFGIGGTNAHVVLEQAPVQQEIPISTTWQLMPLSARSLPALNKMKSNLVEHLQRQPISMQNAAYTLQVGRRAFAHRSFVICQNSQECARLFDETLGVYDGVIAEQAPMVIFDCTFKHALNIELIKTLYKTIRYFREAFDQCKNIFIKILAIDLGAELDKCDALNNERIIHLIKFTLIYAMAAIWRAWGIMPERLIIDEGGEVIAACIAEELELEKAIEFFLQQLTNSNKQFALKIPVSNNMQAEWLTNQNKFICLELIPQQLIGNDIQATLLTTLGNFWLRGIEPNWQALHYTTSVRRIQLPLYPFEHTHYWIEAKQLTVQEEIIPLTEIKQTLHDRVNLKVDYVAPRNEVEEKLVTIFMKLLGTGLIGVQDNFYDLGGHSLLATELTQAIKQTFAVDLSFNLILESPTVLEIANLIAHAKSDDQKILSSTKLSIVNDDLQLDQSIQPPTAFVFRSQPKAVFLTGITGFLGTYLLHELLEKTDAVIYGLARDTTEESALRRIEKMTKHYALVNSKKHSRIKIILGDLSKLKFGMNAESYDQLAEEVDSIYHCGAHLSFIEPYTKLKKINVEGTRSVIQFACHKKTKQIHHVSSIAAYDSDKHKGLGYTDEDLPLEESYGFHSGYDETKWVAEMLMNTAAKRGVPVSIYRPGNISGDSRTGFCSATDLVGILIRGCIDLAAAPMNNDYVDVVPIDYVSRALVHLSLQETAIGQKYNLVNPTFTRWSDIIALLQHAGYKIDLMSFAAWRERLRKAHQHNSKNPLIPLLPTFDERPLFSNRQYSSKKTQAGLINSGIQCSPINAKLINAYLKSLIAQGFLSAGVNYAAS